MQINLAPLINALPEPLRSWVAAYLAPWKKVRRKPFNWIVLGVFVPLTVMQVWLGLQMIDSAAHGSFCCLEDLMLAGDTATPQTMLALQQEVVAVTSPYQPVLSFLKIANYMLMVGLLPLFLMRLRHMQWSHRWVWALYLPLFSEILAMVGAPLPLVIGVVLVLFSLVIFLRLCTHRGVEKEETLV